MKLQYTRNGIRLIGWRLAQLILLPLLFAQRTVAQPSDVNGQLTSATALNAEGPPLADVDRAITLATNYLEHACGSDGKFTYLININSGQQSDSYNIVRHAGVIYALAMLQHPRPDQPSMDAMVRAASFMRQNYIGPGIRPDQLVVWGKPLPHGSAANLGATGLGLVALTAIERAKPNSVPLEQLQALGRFLLFMQRSDGSFISKYRAESGPDEHFESLYYPGEATLGLLELYEADHSRTWLTAAAKALSYLAKSRSGLPTVPLDHWALIATAKLLPHYAESASPASREELIQHAVQICQALMKDQLRNPLNQALDGSFDSMGRPAPTATRMEGLLAALEFLPGGSLRTQVRETVDRGIAFLLRVQIRDGIYAGGMTGAYLSGAFGSTEIRIDFVQHALCAWLRYKQLIQTAKAVEKPIAGRDAGHIRVLFGGDTDFGESYQEEYARIGRGNILAEKGYDYSIANLSRLLQAVDYRVLNMETPLTMHRDGSLKDKEYLHYSDPVKAPAALSSFGPIAYSLANNHTLDQGTVGLEDTLHSLDTAGARHFGAGKDISEAAKPLMQTFRIDGASFTMAIFGGLEYNAKYAEQFHFYADADHSGVAHIDVLSVEKTIRTLRRRTPNVFVVYYMHVLQNYSWKTSFQDATAKALRNAGVDLVIGSGAHMMQEVEYGNNQWIFYGLGNFVFNAKGRTSTLHAPPYSLPLVADFTMDNGHLLATFRVYPILSDNRVMNYQPRFLTEEELHIVGSLLTSKSDWSTCIHATINSGKDDIGRFIEFSEPTQSPKRCISEY